MCQFCLSKFANVSRIISYSKHIWQVVQSGAKRKSCKRKKNTTRGTPFVLVLSNNRLEKVPFVSVLHTSSKRLLLSNQDKGCTPSVAHSLALPLGPALHNLWIYLFPMPAYFQIYLNFNTSYQKKCILHYRVDAICPLFLYFHFRGSLRLLFSCPVSYMPITMPCLWRRVSAIPHNHTPKMILRSAIFSTLKIW